MTWAAALDRLGAQLDRQARKRLLRGLRSEPDLHPAIRELRLTETAQRAIGTLHPEAQRVLAAAPELARKIRRICKLVPAPHRAPT